MKSKGTSRLLIAACAAGLAAATSVGFYRAGKPRPLAPGEVSVAFWAWRNEAPTRADVENALAVTRGNVLFLRAGQFDISARQIRRIRPVSGAIPPAPELHLVYNSTRKLLSEFERLDAGHLASVVVDTYRSDLARAKTDGVVIKGLQIDFDVPTRLLPAYGDVLKRLRQKLPPGAVLSITGLPTWAISRAIEDVLVAVDFWIPQCYGASIPATVSDLIPISSATDVARTIELVRRLNKPFYAGLSVYGYATLYGKDGRLVELRGDISPGSLRGSGLELTATDRFQGSADASEVRYEYRAKEDVVLDGLVIQAGEALVFNMPTVGSVRAAARAVRQNAGGSLLGICLFRMPTAGDKTTLSLIEITSALADEPSLASTTVEVAAADDRQLTLRASNNGNVGTAVSENALTIDLQVPAGSVARVESLDGFSDYESRCGNTVASTPCSSRRADVLRLRSGTWRPGANAAITLSFNIDVPDDISALVRLSLEDGRSELIPLKLQVPTRGEPQ